MGLVHLLPASAPIRSRHVPNSGEMLNLQQPPRRPQGGQLLFAQCLVQKDTVASRAPFVATHQSPGGILYMDTWSTLIHDHGMWDR